MNIIQQSEMLKDISDDRISQEMQQPSGMFPLFLVSSEAKRRSDLRSRYAAEQAEPPTSTVQQDLLAELARQMQSPGLPNPALGGVATNMQPPQPGGAQQGPDMPQPPMPPGMDQAPQMPGQVQGMPGQVQGFADGGQVRGFNGQQGSPLVKTKPAQWFARHGTPLQTREAIESMGGHGVSVQKTTPGADVGYVPGDAVRASIRNKPDPFAESNFYHPMTGVTSNNWHSGYRPGEQKVPLTSIQEDKIRSEDRARSQDPNDFDIPREPTEEEVRTTQIELRRQGYEVSADTARKIVIKRMQAAGPQTPTLETHQSTAFKGPLTPITAFREQAYPEKMPMAQGREAVPFGRKRPDHVPFQSKAYKSGGLPTDLEQATSDVDENAARAKRLSELRGEADPFKALRERLDKRDTKIEKDKGQNINMALIEAGLGIMSGTSQHAMVNIGKGGQAGVKAFAEGKKEINRREDAQFDSRMLLTKADQERDFKLREVSDRYAKGLVTKENRDNAAMQIRNAHRMKTYEINEGNRSRVHQSDQATEQAANAAGNTNRRLGFKDEKDAWTASERYLNKRADLKDNNKLRQYQSGKGDHDLGQRRARADHGTAQQLGIRRDEQAKAEHRRVDSNNAKRVATTNAQKLTNFQRELAEKRDGDRNAMSLLKIVGDDLNKHDDRVQRGDISDKTLAAAAKRDVAKEIEITEWMQTASPQEKSDLQNLMGNKAGKVVFNRSQSKFNKLVEAMRKDSDNPIGSGLSVEQQSQVAAAYKKQGGDMRWLNMFLTRQGASAPSRGTPRHGVGSLNSRKVPATGG